MIAAYTDIISLAQAKTYLRIDDTLNEDDSFITSCINAALQWIEKYTNHILVEQNKEYFASAVYDFCHDKRFDIYDFPIVSIIEPSDVDLIIKNKSYNTKSVIIIDDDVLELNLGYDAVSDIPEPFIQAAFAIIQVWYYNSEKTIQSNLIPDSVKFAINPYRRFPIC
ncbi:Phage gp6-like head-tail connector protein [compost metagenome]